MSWSTDLPCEDCHSIQTPQFSFLPVMNLSQVPVLFCWLVLTWSYGCSHTSQSLFLRLQGQCNADLAGLPTFSTDLTPLTLLLLRPRSLLPILTSFSGKLKPARHLLMFCNYSPYSRWRKWNILFLSLTHPFIGQTLEVLFYPEWLSVRAN